MFEEDKNIKENIIKEIKNLFRLNRLKKEQMMLQLKHKKRF